VDLGVQARRWITALLLLGTLIPIVTLGGQWVFLILIILLVVLCQLEYARLSRIRQGGVERTIGILVAISMPFCAMMAGERGLVMALSASLIVWLTLETAFRKELEGVLHKIGARMLGYLYAALLPSYFILVWKLPNGIHWLFWTITVTAVGDTAAYYVGSLLGRHKLLPRISPNKTVEGAVAGLLGNAAGGLAYAAMFFPSKMAMDGVLLSLMVGAAGQLGDLGESMLKRAVGVKDSGGILPGHGGVLDRFDSLLFSLPVVFYWAIWS
jgi:phosphatidate cytidylyltransferase